MDNKRLLTRDEILNAQDIQTQNVECPEWGGTVCIKMLTAGEADTWRKSMLKKTETRGSGGKMVTDYIFDSEAATNNEILLITLAVVDDKGAALFTAADVEKLLRKSIAPLKRLARAITEQSKLTAEAVEDAIKN